MKEKNDGCSDRSISKVALKKFLKDIAEGLQARQYEYDTKLVLAKNGAINLSGCDRLEHIGFYKGKIAGAEDAILDIMTAAARIGVKV